MNNNLSLEKSFSKNNYGQYFTPDLVANFMIDLADISDTTKILEPSCGQGIFLELLQKRGFAHISAYEIDHTLSTNYAFVKHESFISSDIKEKFDLIIGNPPYIRWKNLEQKLKDELTDNPLWNKYFNSLCDYLYIFILKSVELLKENGQLIFICPEYWLNTTHALPLRNYLVQNGYFEKLFHFNETPIFENVTTSIVIFKYVKTQHKKQPSLQISKYMSRQKPTTEILNDLKSKSDNKNIEHLIIPQFNTNERWCLCSNNTKEKLKLFEQSCKPVNIKEFLFENHSFNYCTLGEVCEIGNGLVSGLDKAFQISEKDLNEAEQQVLLRVVKAKDIRPFFYESITPYFYISDNLTEEEFKTIYPHFYHQLQQYRLELEKRYQYNQKIPYWRWVFPRNYKLFSRDEKRIFVPCKERISHKDYFRFAIVEKDIYPTQDVTGIFKKENTKESLEYITCFLNNYRVFDWLKINGIIKGNIVEFSEKPLASIPFRKIDWNKEEEVAIHQQITQLCQAFLQTQTRNSNLISNIDHLIEKLFNEH
jgi:adenine-specific DNA-methyltransferase